MRRAHHPQGPQGPNCLRACPARERPCPQPPQATPPPAAHRLGCQAKMAVFAGPCSQVAIFFDAWGKPGEGCRRAGTWCGGQACLPWQTAGEGALAAPLRLLRMPGPQWAARCLCGQCQGCAMRHRHGNVQPMRPASAARLLLRRFSFSNCPPISWALSGNAPVLPVCLSRWACPASWCGCPLHRGPPPAGGGIALADAPFGGGAGAVLRGQRLRDAPPWGQVDWPARRASRGQAGVLFAGARADCTAAAPVPSPRRAGAACRGWCGAGAEPVRCA